MEFGAEPEPDRTAGTVAAAKPWGVDGFLAPIGMAKPCFDAVRYLLEPINSTCRSTETPND